MAVFIIVLHVVVCIALILIVLLQSGKGAEMGAAFGGSSQTVFGGAGPAPFLGKITTVAAIVFMITSLSLAYFSANPFGESVMKNVEPVGQQAPAADEIPMQDVQAPVETQSAPAPVADPATQ